MRRLSTRAANTRILSANMPHKWRNSARARASVMLRKPASSGARAATFAPGSERNDASTRAASSCATRDNTRGGVRAGTRPRPLRTVRGRRDCGDVRRVPCSRVNSCRPWCVKACDAASARAGERRPRQSFDNGSAFLPRWAVYTSPVGVSTGFLEDAHAFFVSSSAVSTNDRRKSVRDRSRNSTAIDGEISYADVYLYG